jgi:hypothetical protein
MASLSEDLYRALCVELKLSARRRGITFQQEFERRCCALDDPQTWGDVAARVTIGRGECVTKKKGKRRR